MSAETFYKWIDDNGRICVSTIKPSVPHLQERPLITEERRGLDEFNWSELENYKSGSE